VDFRFSRLV